MEFRIRKAEFLRGLRVAQSIADRRSTMPMLANVLLRTQNGDQVLLAATDLNVSLSATLPCTTARAGSLTVAAKALHDIVNTLPGEELLFSRTENNWAEISAEKVKYRLVGMLDRDFPKIPEHREAEYVEVDAQILREMIDQSLFAVCSDETRFHLNGVFMESDGFTLRMVATDGHRLAKTERQLPAAPALSAGIIIPKKGMTETKRLLDLATTCRLAVKTPYVFFAADNLTLAVKLVDAQFPPYDQVIPAQYSRRVVVSRLRLLDALRRAQLMSSDTRGVKFTIAPGTVILTSDNPDVGEVREELDADYVGDDLSVGFNGKYVVEFLAQMSSERVALQLSGELDPGVLVPENGNGYLGVVMPMRI